MLHGAGAEDFVLTLERDITAETQQKVREADTVQQIRDARVKAFIQTNEGGPGKSLCIQFSSEQGDVLLTEIATCLKKLGIAIDLHVEGSKVTDRGLAALEGLNCLRLINLEGTPVSDAGIDHLKKLDRLSLLIVSDTRVTAAGVERLKRSLPTLKVTNRTRAQSTPRKRSARLAACFTVIQTIECSKSSSRISISTTPRCINCKSTSMSGRIHCGRSI